jgi:hypothetical protein
MRCECSWRTTLNGIILRDRSKRPRRAMQCVREPSDASQTVSCRRSSPCVAPSSDPSASLGHRAGYDAGLSPVPPLQKSALPPHPPLPPSGPQSLHMPPAQPVPAAAVSAERTHAVSRSPRFEIPVEGKGGLIRKAVSREARDPTHGSHAWLLPARWGKVHSRAMHSHRYSRPGSGSDARTSGFRPASLILPQPMVRSDLAPPVGQSTDTVRSAREHRASAPPHRSIA